MIICSSHIFLSLSFYKVTTKWPIMFTRSLPFFTCARITLWLTSHLTRLSIARTPTWYLWKRCWVNTIHISGTPVSNTDSGWTSCWLLKFLFLFFTVIHFFLIQCDVIFTCWTQYLICVGFVAGLITKTNLNHDLSKKQN